MHASTNTDHHEGNKNHALVTLYTSSIDINEHEWIVTTCRKGVRPQDQLGPNGLYQ